MTSSEPVSIYLKKFPVIIVFSLLFRLQRFQGRALLQLNNKYGYHVIVAVLGLKHAGRLVKGFSVCGRVHFGRETQRQNSFRHETQVHGRRRRRSSAARQRVHPARWRDGRLFVFHEEYWKGGEETKKQKTKRHEMIIIRESLNEVKGKSFSLDCAVILGCCCCCRNERLG